MGTDAVSTISTYFRVCDGVRVRFADNKADSGVTMLLLAPWPESLLAFRRIWKRVYAEGLSTISGLQEKVLHEPASMERLLLDLSKKDVS